MATRVISTVESTEGEDGRARERGRAHDVRGGHPQISELAGCDRGIVRWGGRQDQCTEVAAVADAGVQKKRECRHAHGDLWSPTC